MATEKDVLELAQHIGILCKTWSPGDRITRYKFFTHPGKDQCYFGPANSHYVALGAREALAFLDGVRAGLELSKQEV